MAPQAVSVGAVRMGALKVPGYADQTVFTGLMPRKQLGHWGKTNI